MVQTNKNQYDQAKLNKYQACEYGHKEKRKRKNAVHKLILKLIAAELFLWR